MNTERLHGLLRELLLVEVEDDGIEFQLDSITVRSIRVESPVLGLRAKFDAQLGRARLRYQVDVGLGDAVFPPAESVVPGGLLGFPMASVRAYTPYTTVAEKLESIAELGEANSRLKDYYDLALLPRALAFDGPTLVESIRRTFARRATAVPPEPLEGLSDAFKRGRKRGRREVMKVIEKSPTLIALKNGRRSSLCRLASNGGPGGF